MFHSEVITILTPSAAVTTTTAGTTGVDEVQEVAFTNAISGTFTLDYDGDETDPLTFPPVAEDVKDALEALDGIDVDDLTVTVDDDDYTITVTFGGSVAETNVAELTVTHAGLMAEVPVVYFDNEMHSACLYASAATVLVGGEGSQDYLLPTTPADALCVQGAPGTVLYATATTGTPTVTVLHMNLSRTPE